MKRKTAITLVKDELDRVQTKHPPIASCHEGYAVLLEEVDELWDEIKGGQGAKHRGVSEAVQVAAMALRYLIDLCEETAATEHETKVKNYRPMTSSYGGYSG